MIPIGTKVMINDEGHYRYGIDEGNPQGVIGTVIECEAFDQEDWINVEWPNDRTNNYEDGTLDIVEG